MQTARRLYVYLLTGISLGALVSGLSILLTVLLHRLGLGPSGDALFAGEEALRQQLTVGSALTAVSLPVWLIHWSFAERSVRPQRPSAAVERASTVRGLYFALALGALLLLTGIGLFSTLEGMTLRLVGADDRYGDIGGSLALAIAAGTAYAYHVAIRERDWARGPLTGAAAWLPRVYLYVATFAGLVVLLNGITRAVELIGRVLIDEPAAFAAVGPWWAYPVAAATAAIVIGGATWLGHSWYAERQRADAGYRGAAERPARVRLAFFVVTILATATMTVLQAGDGLGNAIAALLGVPETAESDQTIALVVLPILTATVFGTACWLHVRALRSESAALELPGRVDTATRLETYSLALIGLAVGAVAVAMLLGLLIDVLFAGRPVSGSGWLRELAQFTPYALLGWGLWIWCWREVQRRSAVDPDGEALSTTRQAAILIVLGAGVLAGIGSLGTILYRLFGSLFGIEQPLDAMAELSDPIGILLTAVAVALFHVIVLRRDQRLRAERSGAVDLTSPAPAFEAALRLRGPAAADLPALVAALREQLPPGYSLDISDAAPDG